MIIISERVVLAWWLVGQSQNPGQIHYFCRSVRDTGQELQIRDCPGRSGTVGAYVNSSLNVGLLIVKFRSIP